MRKLTVCTCCLFIALTLGCGSKSDLQKVIVSGSVSFDGMPVENGQIYFYPAEGTKGPVSGAPIKDGAYVARAKGGVPVGTHSVKIEGYRSPNASSDGDMLTRASSGGAPVQYIPAKYNQSTELETTIPGDSRKFTNDYDLEP